MNYEKLGEWKELQAQLSVIKDKEMALRQEIFNEVFASPIEGTNTIDLPEGWQLKGTYKLNRAFDEAALPAILEQLKKKKISVDALIHYKPSLDTKVYRNLKDEHRALFDQALVIKPGAPSLELIPPKS